MKLIFEVMPWKPGERWAILLFNHRDTDVYLQLLPWRHRAVGHTKMWYDGPIHLWSFVFFEIVTMNAEAP